MSEDVVVAATAREEDEGRANGSQNNDHVRVNRDDDNDDVVDDDESNHDDCECEYFLRYTQLMATIPSDLHVHRFADPELSEVERAKAVQWLRSTEDESPLRLQILFSFSIPTNAALDFLLQEVHVALNIATWYSCGSGTGYWERLLLDRWQQRKQGKTGGASGLDAHERCPSHLAIVCFDKNTTYPEAMRFLPILTAGPETLVASTAGDCLLLAWPDEDDASTFGRDCVASFQGNTVVHIGELFGDSMAASPWGQSTSEACQKQLASSFRISHRLALPQWPYQRDCITVWRRIEQPIDCDGAAYSAFRSVGKEAGPLSLD